MKDAYYFSHDSTAHKDPKVLRLRAKYGWEGYGIYWAIIETLRDQDNYSWPEEDRDMLAFHFSGGEPPIMEVIEYCITVGLLVVEDGAVYSPSLSRRMGRMEEGRKRRSSAGKKGAKSRWSKEEDKNGSDGNANGTAMALPSKDDAMPLATDSKGKESKGKEILTDVDGKEEKRKEELRAYIADVNVDEENYVKVLTEEIRNRDRQVETVLMKSRIPDMGKETRNRIWKVFLENAVQYSPRITSRDHAFNIWRRYMLGGEWKKELETPRKSKITDNTW